MVRYDGEKFPLHLNVRKGLNDRKYTFMISLKQLEIPPTE